MPEIDSQLPATRPAGSVGTVSMGVMPTDIGDAWRLSQFFAKSSLVPDDFKGKPENVLVALQLGAEVGFPPMQALQSIAVINGRPSIWGDGFLALLMNSSKYRAHEEYYEVAVQKDVETVDEHGKRITVKRWVIERREGLSLDDWKRDDTAAVCAFWRTDREAPIVVRFTVGQAKKANLLSKKGPWQEYPDRMLKLRARSWAGRDAFPDVLRGLTTREEALDRREVIDTQVVQPRRASEARPAATATPSAASSSATTTASDASSRNAETPAPSEARPAEASTPARIGQDLRGLRIVGTSFVRPKPDTEPYFEIVAKTTTGKEKKFITRDEAVYKEAASFEGTDHAVIATVYSEGTDLVLERLAIYEGGAPGELFGS
jgi:RecT family